MIEIKLTEDHGGFLTTNDLQWFQDAVLSASGHAGDPFHISITDGKISCLVPQGEQ